MKKSSFFVKIFSLCCIVCLIFTGLTLVGCKKGEPELKNQIITENFIFNKIDNKNEYELAGASSTYSQGTNMVIPEEVEGYPVTKISDFAFTTSFQEQVENSNAYYDFDDTLNPDKFLVKKLSISSLTIGNNIKEIGRCAFACNDISELTIPSSVETIGDNAFYMLENLKTLTFADNSNLKTIGNFSFGFNELLRSLEVPASTTYVGRYSFYNCSNLETLTFEENSSLFEIGGHAFESTAIDSVILPNSVFVMGKAVFQHCAQLHEITLPNQLTEINVQMFYNTPSLKSITIPASVQIIRDSAFTNSHTYTNGEPTYPTLEEVHFEANSKLEEISSSAFQGCVNLSEINLGACTKLKTIGTRAFYDVCKIEWYSISGTIETIGDYAFAINDLNENNILLTYINFDTLNGASNLKTIGNFAFNNSESLQIADLTYCSNLTSIGSSAFKGCSALEEIYIPASVTNLGYDTNTVFYGTNLQKVIIGNIENFFKINFANNLYANPIYEGEYLYTRIYDAGQSQYQDTPLTEIDLSNSDITEIKPTLLYNCKNIETIKLPATLEVIGAEAFKNCINLKSIEIPANVTIIGERAFESAFTNTTNQSVSFAENSKLRTIEQSTFKGCSTLEKIDLRNCVELKEIKTSSFRDTLSLTEIFIPASVEKIGTDLFLEANPTLNITTFFGTGISKVIVGHDDSNKEKSINEIIANYFCIQFGNNYSNPLHAAIDASTAVQKTMFVRVWDEVNQIYTEQELHDIDLSNSGIEAISNNIMKNNKSLETIILPNTLVTIGANAFSSCINLESIEIPASVTTIGTKAFENSFTNKTGQKITFEQNSKLSTIEEGAFKGCKTLVDIDLRNCNSLKTIKAQSFRDTLSLTEIFIPASVEELGNDTAATFYGTNITKVIVADIISFFKINFGSNFANPLHSTKTGSDIAKTMFIRRYNEGTQNYIEEELKTIDLSNSGITIFSNGIMKNNTSLTSITLPTTLREIGNDSFKKCANLTTLTLPASLEKVGSNTLASSGVLNVTFEEVGVTWYGYLNNDLTSEPLEKTTTSTTSTNASIFRSNSGYVFYKTKQNNTAA